MASSSPPWCHWSELPRDILGLVSDGLPSAAGRRRGIWSAACSWLLFWSACYCLLRALLGSLARFRAARSSHHHTTDSIDHTADFGAVYRSWRMADSVDRARFRAAYRAHCMVEAVCRLWPAAANEHIPCLPRRRPWIVLLYPYFITSSGDSSSCRHRFPCLWKNTACVGSTNDWIALRRVVVGDVHSYLLHNHFSDMADLDALIGDTSRIFKVLKVLKGPADPCHCRVWPMWSELPPDVLGLVIDRLASSLPSSLPYFRAACPSHRHSMDSVDHTMDSVDRGHFHAAYRSWCMTDSVDRASFRTAYRAHRMVEAVCRSWRATACEHLPCPPRRLPWILLTYSRFMTSSDTCSRRLPSVPENVRCIGSTDDWITLHRVVVNNDRKMHSYLLHNPFYDMTMPLPELDAIIGNNVSVSSEIRKVLMRSTPHDIIAILTSNTNYPIILVRPGKGVWLPRPRSAPFIYIIDIAFIGDRLYGITKAEDLIYLDIAFDASGMPTVTRTKRVIRHPFKTDDRSKVWSNVDRFRVWAYPSKIDDGYDLWSDVDEKHHKYVAKDSGDQDRDTINGEHDYDCVCNIIEEGIHYAELSITTWQIVESLGKLLMVRRKQYYSLHSGRYTRNADVFEANVAMGAWVPVKDGLCGQALFISRYCCKSIHASGEIEKDAVYFADTGEVLDLRSKIISQPQRDLWYRCTMWLFPPEPDVYTIYDRIGYYKF
ncbi:hypothetical protein CFC21_045008 [Triticum aestivum]|uniref:KIB1-4 beta-propeller domain-containing protein n=2 Tax=Triticum aestivum TaxID=4565 RepID=A0A9R1JY67_WHEAT|nr:hypothetical protein CFC21_045004 [Triticum aestivum]KAF7033944.1 hypothetical protein CFC21_045008 [Triticum aestivum]